MNLEKEINTMFNVVKGNPYNNAWHTNLIRPDKESYFQSLLTTESIAEVRKTLESQDINTPNMKYNLWKQLTIISHDWIRLYEGTETGLVEVCENIIKRMKLVVPNGSKINAEELAVIWIENPWVVAVMLLELVPYAYS